MPCVERNDIAEGRLELMRPPLRAPATALAMCLLSLSACNDVAPAAERVEAFCSDIRKGEQIEPLLARYGEFHLQPGGAPPDRKERLAAVVDAEVLTTINGVLAEPIGSGLGAPRPVCAIYYSDRLLGGDSTVVAADFIPKWRTRY